MGATTIAGLFLFNIGFDGLNGCRICQAARVIKNPLNPFNPMFKIKSPMMNDVRTVSHLSCTFTP